MFGYVKACKPELKVKEFELYKAVYCSLCRTLGKQYGILARFTLSYDFTFLSLLTLSLEDGCCPTERKSCVYNPLKKCNYLKSSDELLAFPAAAAAILLYYKIQDNIADEKGVKRACYQILNLFYKRYHKKAAVSYPKIEESVKTFVEQQAKLEQDGCMDIDRAADPTANMLSQLFVLVAKDKDSRALARMGYCIGKWIYLMDVANDLSSDIKKGSYNPLKTEAKDIIDYKDFARNRLEPELTMCAAEAAAAFELVEIYKYKDILGNIIYLGLEKSQREVFSKEKKNKK